MSGDTFSGERCFLHCQAGYKAFGKRVAVCNNLQWHPKAELKCVPVPSRAPAAVQLTPVASSSHHQQQLPPQQHHLHHRPTIKCPGDMTIIKPKNQDTILVRISKPETNVDWNQYVDSQPKWAKRLEATLSVGATEVTFRARSPTSNQFDICRVIINVVDPSPPTVTFCPEPFIVDLLPHEESRPIFWEEPTFESKHTIKQIFKSKVPGHRFGIGVHPITYVASTQEGLSAKCSFRVTVKGKNFENNFFPGELSIEILPGHEVPYHSQKVSLETNMITDESPELHLENHESFLECPGKHPIKIKANQPVSIHIYFENFVSRKNKNYRRKGDNGDIYLLISDDGFYDNYNNSHNQPNNRINAHHKLIKSENSLQVKALPITKAMKRKPN